MLIFLCKLGEHLEAKEGASTASEGSVGAIVGIVIAVLIILLIVTDVSCYFINGCGALAAVCSQVRGHSPTSKEKTMEEGDRYLAIALVIHRVQKKVIYLFFSYIPRSFFDIFYETFKQWRKCLAACVSA